MTKSQRGSSLPQARSYHHNHYHLHNRRAATPENAHHRQHRQLDDLSPTPPSPDAQPSTTGKRIVVQTVSIIQIVDASGVPIAVQTQYPTTSATVDANPTASSAALDSTVAVRSPTSTRVSTPESSSAPDDATPSTPAATKPSSTDTPASQDTSLTSTLLSTTPAPSAPGSSLFPSLSGHSNSTIPFLGSSNSSVSTTTTLSSRLSSGTNSVTSSLLSSLSSTWDSTSDSTSTSIAWSTTTFATSASSTWDPIATGDAIVGGGGAARPTSPPTSTTDDPNSDPPPPPTATVVGSVVGSLAGAAFLVVLVYLALRWKKRSGGRLRLSEASLGKRGILTGSSGPGGGSGGGMIQRSSSYGPVAAAAGVGAAAAAAPKSRRASEPSDTGERGFVRVAGRKLPSVLQSGGDGYTDPREGVAGSVTDGDSIYYRDSQAFFDPSSLAGGGQTPRLALGSPMRPVSGVVVFKQSPARTPITESTPFADPNAQLSPLTPPPRDPIGRTMPSQDGSRDSRGSASRFQEQM